MIEPSFSMGWGPAIHPSIPGHSWDPSKLSRLSRLADSPGQSDWLQIGVPILKTQKDLEIMEKWEYHGGIWVCFFLGGAQFPGKKMVGSSY